MAKPRSLTTSAPRRDDVAPGYVADPNAPGPMVRYENSLPRLPVPELSSTAAKYLETVQPHVTPEEFATTQQAVQRFLQSDLAKQLQDRLKQRAADPNVKNWLADWWNDVAYMAYRDSVVVNVSYYYVHVDDKNRPGQAKRAATLLKAMLPFRTLVEQYVLAFSREYRVLTSLCVGTLLSQRKFAMRHSQCRHIVGCKCSVVVVVHILTEIVAFTRRDTP